ncbi:hypothetical protein CYG48_08890 [Neorhizobium sp. SOG26]|nr:hypothetical protein CYG48_08890 [Neorhizobium sp. SOG26]
MLPKGWYLLYIADGVDPDRPGIYQWEIEGAGVYIGKYTRRSRPFLEYERNVIKILVGRPYRPQKPAAFRRIHRELCAAHLEGRAIKLTILENCTPEQLSERESELIRDRGTLNGRQKT